MSLCLRFLNAPFVPQPVAPIMKEFNEYPEMADPENPVNLQIEIILNCSCENFFEDEMIQSPDSMFKEEEDVRPPEPEPEAVNEETVEENAETTEEAPEAAET